MEELFTLKGVWIAALCLVISGCTQPPAFDRTWRAGLLDSEEIQEVDISIGINDPCLPPCWHGLVPQVSTLTDVAEVLDNLETIDSESIQTQTIEETGITLVTWKSALSDNQIYQGTATLSNDRLVFIDMVLAYELTMDDITAFLNEPELYQTLPDYGKSWWMVRFMWPSDGFVAETPMLRAGSRVTPEVLVQRIAYFSPGSDAASYLMAKSGSTQYIDEFRSWPGFDGFRVP